MKQHYRKLVTLTITLLFLFLSQQTTASIIKGTVVDKNSKEPLIGATVKIAGTNTGVVTDFDGNFNIEITSKENCTLEIKYISYKTLVVNAPDLPKESTTVVLELEPENLVLADVTIVARKNMESDKILSQERQKAVFAIENIGAKEMSLKGVSNVSDGVKKITGISVASAGQIIVRGLGDRYSATTLNGLPIASPNPDNKLIPLDLFPTNMVKNITVSKVYSATRFGDYSGALIDISTKENIGPDFFSLSASTGGNFNTLFKDFYHSDRKGIMLSNNKLTNELSGMSNRDFDSYIKSNDPFGTSFSIKKINALPEFGVSAGLGKSWQTSGGQISLLASGGVSNERETLNDAFITTINAQGVDINHFDYDSYTTRLKIAGLLSLGYTFRKADRLNYTLFYARNAIDNYMRREGYDAEKVDLIGSNSVFHAYSLLNNQLAGHHELGERWKLDWSASYGITGSDEPDRRQVMFRKDNGNVTFFKLNRQETMRYFGDLDEEEIVGDLRLAYDLGRNNRVQVGGAYKDKTRDFHSERFYYNLNRLDAQVDNIFQVDEYLNQENITNGTITIQRDNQDKYNYFAGNQIWAGFIDFELYPFTNLLLNLGIRYENSNQWVRYWNDASVEKRSELDSSDFFPALNVKYTINEQHNLRLAASRTVTRPSFVEMAPFLYKASYGSAEIRGNENLQNGYNYNIDLRYEFYPAGSNDLFSITGYYKKLKSPIERVQESSGGSAVHSFRNANDGMAAGLEVEIRKELFKDFNLSLNGSYMYTNVKLPLGEGVYTDIERELQGASPYLANADISYTPAFGDDKRLALALVYNLQGPRINTVGIYKVGNIEQQTLHTLNFVAGFDFNTRFSMSLQMKNLLNSTIEFKQDVPITDETVTVESFKPSINAEIGLTYKF